MKKIFLYALMLFSGFSCISCSDDEKGMANISKLARFRMDLGRIM